MTRVPQPEGRRGSLKWIQRLASSGTDLFEARLRHAGALAPADRFTWLSPLKQDDWAEYRDEAFLERLGRADLIDRLARFWPHRGPQWDGLGADSSGNVYLIEAKAHLTEMETTCAAAGASRLQIENSLAEVKAALMARQEADWLQGYYQYANRLAHLHFLKKAGASARLLFLYFTDDRDMPRPASAAEWDAATSQVAVHLGLPARPADVFDIHIDVASLLELEVR